MSLGKILYFGVYDQTYPRNSRIRSFLTHEGYDVTSHSKSRAQSAIRRWYDDLKALRALLPNCDAIVLSEFSSKYALFARLLLNSRSQVLIVDGFVGLHETRIIDWELYKTSSIRALIYRALDYFAWRFSDFYLIDNKFREAELKMRYSRIRSSPLTISLPVGAPDWARPTRKVDPDRASEDIANILYYGNYIPLHGTDKILHAFSSLSGTIPAHLTLIGDGQLRHGVELLATDMLVPGTFTFIDPVPQEDLAAYISNADVVLGVFGDSEKARSVIANKVWQGLACGKTVVTQDSVALEEIRHLVGEQLITSSPGDVESIRLALKAASSSREIVSDTHVVLESYVTDQFNLFSASLRDLFSQRRKLRRSAKPIKRR